MVDSLETRRQQLEAKLAARTLEDEDKAVDNSKERHGFALAIKLSSEFIAAVFVGALIGYVLDKYVGTTPWGMIIFLLLGFVAGVMNVLRSVGAVERPKPGFSSKNKGSQDQED